MTAAPHVDPASVRLEDLRPTTRIPASSSLSSVASAKEDQLTNTRRVFVCVNGILNRPGDSDGWTDRAVTWLHLHTDARAEKFEYAAGALTRRLWQQDRAIAIARMVNFYHRAGFAIALVGHSNGCDLIGRVLRLTSARFVAVHLFAAATDEGLITSALERGQIYHLHLYGSANDRALQLAQLSRSAFGWLGLGYGDLGLRTDAYAAAHARTWSHRDDAQTHSSWFARGPRFEATMQAIAANTVW